MKKKLISGHNSLHKHQVVSTRFFSRLQLGSTTGSLATKHIGACS